MASIVYTIDARLGASGIGNWACKAAAAIYRSGQLARLFVSSNAQTAVPVSLIDQWGLVGRGLKYLAARDSTGLVNVIERTLFDAWVAARLRPADVFHAWNGSCMQSLRRAKRYGMITVVERASSHPTTQRRLLDMEHRRWGVPLRWPAWSYRRSTQEIEEAQFVAIPSAFVRATMMEAGIPLESLIEIAPGVEVERFFPASLRPAHPFRLIFVGQVSLRKGIPYLLEAWKQLGWTDAELWIVGRIAPGMSPLLRRWRALGGVRFVDHSADVPSFLRQASLFVFPTIEEGSAQVTYEALASGLPVITTPNAGSVVRDGEDGFIVPIRDVEALCQAIQRLRGDEDLRTRMQHSARQRAEEFTWEAYQRRLTQAYRSLDAHLRSGAYV